MIYKILNCVMYYFREKENSTFDEVFLSRENG